MFWSHGTNSARGVAVYINKKVDCKPVHSYRDEEGRMVAVVLDLNGQRISIVNVYAPNPSFLANDILAHQTFFEDLAIQLNTIKAQHNVAETIIMGDFNTITNINLDAYGGNPRLYSKSLETIEVIKAEHGLCDIFRELNPDKRLCTFSPGGLNVRNIYRRLDYILIPETWRGLVKTTEIIPAPHSDHRLIKLTMCKDTDRKNIGLWRHNDSINNNKEYNEEFNTRFPSWVEDAETLSDPRSRWELIKFHIKNHSRSFSIKLAKRKREFKKSAELRMIDLDNKIMINPENTEIASQYVQAKTIYDSILEEENEQLRFRARVAIYEKGEKSTDFFFRQIKQNASRSNITSLEIEGNMSENHAEINKAIYKYYKELYREELNVSQAIATDKCSEFLVDELPRISKEQKIECDKKISPEEVRQILFKELNGKKSPGNDGLTVSLYQSKWDLLEPLFLSVLNMQSKGVNYQTLKNREW